MIHLFFFLLISSTINAEAVPQWENLECEVRIFRIVKLCPNLKSEVIKSLNFGVDLQSCFLYY